MHIVFSGTLNQIISKDVGILNPQVMSLEYLWHSRHTHTSPLDLRWE